MGMSVSMKRRGRGEGVFEAGEGFHSQPTTHPCLWSSTKVKLYTSLDTKLKAHAAVLDARGKVLMGAHENLVKEGANMSSVMGAGLLGCTMALIFVLLA